MPVDPDPRVQELLGSIRARLPALQELHAEVSGHWGYEDGLYRFYHQSWKVYGLQHKTQAIVDALAALAPDRPLNPWFLEIIRCGTGHEFERSHNDAWLDHTRPIVEAFLHAKYFLEMSLKYGADLEEAPSSMPSGWASVLCLYGLR